MRERNDHMALIKPLGKRWKIKWKTTLRQMFRYAKRHEEKRDIEGVTSSREATWQNLMFSYMGSLDLVYNILILILMICVCD